ncbi:hypothetical protein CAPTEDRAFT_193119 [Capitella teleta]|uniref:Protein UBASH3A homolog n=1 Tax=Capitella teleta TaxID=283909 RepID=R7UNE6_CAPTE|nr:hypothetical protein CAPTEDRAFT_193119 [Capitella teleta]|eukprot:ELU07750.1 hypothetical protein CAPTEDRAFT_193119 [Capitella teleta]
MAAMELPPRRSRKQQQEITIQRNRSALDVLMQMGFPRHRAEKALAATGDKGVQLASDWLLSHVNDPNLDDRTARDYILYLCPVGQLQHELLDFWQKSYQECGWNRAHNYFPHITLCSFFKADDAQVSKLSHAIKTIAERIGTLPEVIELEYFSSANFIGLFVTESFAPLLKQITADFAEEVKKSLGVTVEPHKKQLHVSLAYQFPAEHRERLENIAKNINKNLPVRWDLRMYSRDPKTSNCQVRKVLYTHTPQAPDELDLLDGDFIFLDETEIESSPDGWYQGTSWLTGCMGMFAGNYTERTGETETWTMHRSIPIVGTDLLLGAAGRGDQLEQDEYEHNLPVRHTQPPATRDQLYTRLQHESRSNGPSPDLTAGSVESTAGPPVPRLRRSASGTSSALQQQTSNATGPPGGTNPGSAPGAASPSSSSSAASSPGASKPSRQITRVPSDLSMSDSPKTDRKGPAPLPPNSDRNSRVGVSSGIASSPANSASSSGPSTGTHIQQRTGSGQISNYVNVPHPKTGTHSSLSMQNSYYTVGEPMDFVESPTEQGKAPSTAASTIGGVAASPKPSRRSVKEGGGGGGGTAPQMRGVRHVGPRQLYVVRHGERIDFTFGKDWIQNSFDQTGNYIRYDLNMPKNLPKRKGGPQDFSKDSPLTIQGHFQARLAGEAMKEKDIPIAHVYSSPSLRCIETAASILRGLSVERDIHVEPGLFEWLGWYQSGIPRFLTLPELTEWGFCVDATYSAILPTSKYNMQETTEQHYDRCYQTTKDILRRHENEGGNVLVVAHAASLDVCTRQLVGQAARSHAGFHDVLHKIPYCAMSVAQEACLVRDTWYLIEPPILPFAHTNNPKYNWTCLTTPSLV